MNQLELQGITWNLLKAREKSHVQGAIKKIARARCDRFWFCFSLVKKKLAQDFKPITKRSNSNCVIVFGSHLKTPLSN